MVLALRCSEKTQIVTFEVMGKDAFTLTHRYSPDGTTRAILQRVPSSTASRLVICYIHYLSIY